MIGKGAYGEVILVQKRTGPQNENKLFAMKKLSKRQIVEGGLQENLVTERNILSKMQHPLIVRMHYAF